MVRFSTHRAQLVIPMLASFFISACSQPAWLSPAETGQFDSARESLQQENLTTQRDAKELALAVLNYEIEHAQVDHQAGIDDTTFISSLTACVGSTKNLLEKRARADDNIAAEAALILLENGYYSRSKAAKARNAESGAWRALAAAISDRDPDAERHAYFKDPDTRVRRAALRAARKAENDDDAQDLLEVARLDPDSMARSLAISTLAHLKTEALVQSLLDLYEMSKQAEQLQIIEALASKELFRSGGKERLETLVAKENDLQGIYAARALLKGLKREKKDAGDSLEMRQSAVNKLLEFSAGGSSSEARAALRALPLDDPEALNTLKEAALNEDSTISVIALARLAGISGAPRALRQALVDIVNEKKPASLQALAALAALGEPNIKPTLLKLSRSTSMSSRRVAANAFLRMADYEHLAPLLLDKSSSLRRHTACRLLAKR